MTVQQFLNLIFRDLQVTYSGQTPSTDQSNDGFTTLNEVLASWSHEGLLLPTHALTQFSLTSGTSAYAMGVGATWVTSALPIKIKGAVSSLGAFQQGATVLPMELFEASIADGIGKKAALPLKLGVDNAAPQRNVRLWPTPNNSSAVIEVSYWTPLTAFAALSDAVSFALPGFQEALRNELTLRLASMHGIPVTPVMLANAQSSKQALARLNPAEVIDPAPAPPVGPASSQRTGQ